MGVGLNAGGLAQEQAAGKSPEPVHPPQYCYGGRAGWKACAR